MRTTLDSAAMRRLTRMAATAVPARPRGLSRVAASPARHPIHVVYGGAHLYKSGTIPRLGELALAALHTYAPDDESFAESFGLSLELARLVRPRVEAKLRAEPVEAYHIDFEDGYGPRPPAEEDADALRCAAELAAAQAEGGLPPWTGIRVKPLNEECAGRSLRTLDLFLTAFAAGKRKRLPAGFAVCLPKVSSPKQVSALRLALEALERRLGQSPIAMELMVETPRALLDAQGRSALTALLRAAGGRLSAAHLGPYDLTASLGVAASQAAPGHPACEQALVWMQLALAGTGVRVADGPTTLLPIPPHRGRGATLNDAQRAENAAAVRAAWRASAANIRRALRLGVTQGWDLHPAQLPARYAAAYAFYLEGLGAAAARLRNLAEEAARATTVGAVFDDAATGQGLLNFFLEARGCGAITDAEAQASGVSPEELAERSFTAIAEARRRRAGAAA